MRSAALAGRQALSAVRWQEVLPVLAASATLDRPLTLDFLIMRHFRNRAPAFFRMRP